MKTLKRTLDDKKLFARSSFVGLIATVIIYFIRTGPIIAAQIAMRMARPRHLLAGVLMLSFSSTPALSWTASKYLLDINHDLGIRRVR